MSVTVWNGEDGLCRYLVDSHKEARFMPTELRELPDRGWDWNDLAYALGFGAWDAKHDWVACDFDEDDLLELVRARIARGDEAVLALVRRFLQSFIKFCQAEATHHDLPLWEGLARVQDDFTFRKYATLLVGHWWD